MRRSLVFLAFLTATSSAWAEEALLNDDGEEAPPPPEDSRETLEQMAAQIEELSGHVERLAQGLGDEQEARQELQERLNRQQVILEAAARRDEAEYDRQQQRAQALVYSRAQGLRWRIAPERFELGLRGFLWARYSGGYRTDDEESHKAWLNEFTIPQVRLRLTAQMGGGMVRGVFEPTYSSDVNGNNGDVGIHDGYLELRLHPAFNIRGGQMRVGLDRETNTPLTRLPTADYSPLQWFFSHGWDLGLMIHGTAGNRFAYGVGMYNGSGGDSENENASLLWSVLLRVRALGEGSWTAWTDLERSSEFRLNLGAAFTHNTEQHIVRLRVTGDIQMQWAGLTIAYLAYYQGLHIQEDGWRSEEFIHSHGHQVHVSFVPWRNRMELFFRFSWLDPDTETDEEFEDSGYELTAGFALFLIGHNAKLTAQYAYDHHMEGFPRDALVHIFRLQAQVWF